MEEEGNNLLVYLKNVTAFLLLSTIFTVNLQWILQLKLQLMGSHIHSSPNSTSQALFWSLTANLTSYSHSTCQRSPPGRACASIDPSKKGLERGLPKYWGEAKWTAVASSTLAWRETAAMPCHAFPTATGHQLCPGKPTPASLSFFRVKGEKHRGPNDSRASQRTATALQSGLRQVNGCLLLFYPSGSRERQGGRGPRSR